MTYQEAASALGLEPDDTEITIKRKYHALLHRYHPDTGAGSDDAVRMIVEAYRMIREAPEKIRSFRKRPDAQLPQINPAAYCKRTLFGRHELFGDDPADVYVRARGAFFWDPPQEEFSLYLRSVLLEARRITEKNPEDLKKVFHLLAQEYIRPLECLKKVCDGIEEDNDSSGSVKPEEVSPEQAILYILEGRTVSKLHKKTACTLRSAQIHAGSERISFDDDSYYYITTMLLARKAAEIFAEPAGGPGRRVRLFIRITDEKEAGRPGNASKYINL